MSYSSKHFSKIPDHLTSQVPNKIIHKALLPKTIPNDDPFSLERKHFVSIADLPSKTMSMTLGSIEQGQSTGKHRHNYETLIYIIEGQGMSVIENQEYRWEKNDAVYIPIWAWHHHVNLGETMCWYIACENAPMLQNLGEIALREEFEK